MIEISSFSQFKKIKPLKIIFSPIIFLIITLLSILFLSNILCGSYYTSSQITFSLIAEHKSTDDPLSFKINKTSKGYKVDFEPIISKIEDLQDQEILFFDENTQQCVLTSSLISQNILKLNILTPSLFIFHGLRNDLKSELHTIKIQSPGKIKLIDSLLTLENLIVQAETLKLKFKKENFSLYARNIIVDTYHFYGDSSKLRGEDFNFTLNGPQSSLDRLLEIDQFGGFKTLRLFMPQTNFTNKTNISLNHPCLAVYFQSIINRGSIDSQGQLYLESFTDFFNSGQEAKISARYDLLTKTAGIHTNHGILFSEKGKNINSATSIYSKNAFYEGTHIVQYAKENISHQGVNIKARGDVHFMANNDIRLLSKNEEKNNYHNTNLTPQEEDSDFQENFLDIEGALLLRAQGKVNLEILKAIVNKSIFINGQQGVFLKSSLTKYVSEKKFKNVKTFGNDNEFLFNLLTTDQAELQRTGETSKCMSTIINTRDTLTLLSQTGPIELQSVTLMADKNIILECLEDLRIESLKITISDTSQTDQFGIGNKLNIIKKEVLLENHLKSNQSDITLRSYEGKIKGEGIQAEAYNNFLIYGKKGISFINPVLKTEENKISSLSTVSRTIATLGLGVLAPIPTLLGSIYLGAHPEGKFISNLLWTTVTGKFGEKKNEHVSLSFLRAGNNLEMLSEEGNIDISGIFKESNNLIFLANEIYLKGSSLSSSSKNLNFSFFSTKRDERKGTYNEPLTINVRENAEFRTSKGPIESRDLEMKVNTLSIFSPTDIKLSGSLLEKTSTIQNQGINLNLFGFEFISPEFENDMHKLSLTDLTSRLRGINTSIEVGYQKKTNTQTTQSNVTGNIHANHINLQTGNTGKVSVKSVNIGGCDEDKVEQLDLNTSKLSLEGSSHNEASTTDGWGINIGYDLVTETPSIGGNYAYDHTYSTTHQKTQLQVDSLINKRQETEIRFEGAIQANINGIEGNKTKIHIEHAQNKLGQEGYSGGANIGIRNFGCHGNYKTGSQTFSKDAKAGENLTKVNIGVESNIERIERHYQDEDTRVGFGGGMSIGTNNFGMNASIELGDNKVHGGFSMGKDAKGGAKNNFNLGIDTKYAKLDFESNIFRELDGESLLSNVAQIGDKISYGIQQASNIFESGNNIAKYYGAGGLDIDASTMSKIRYYLGLCRQGSAALDKIGRTDWGKDFSNKIIAYISSNTCAHHGLEHLLEKPFQQIASHAKLGISLSGLTLLQIEEIIQAQQQKGAIQNYHIQTLQQDGNIMNQLNALNISKAAYIFHDPANNQDHMVLLQKNEAGLWGAYDVKEGAHVPHDFRNFNGSKGTLVAVNTANKTSISDYDRNRQVYVGATSSKRAAPSSRGMYTSQKQKRHYEEVQQKIQEGDVRDSKDPHWRSPHIRDRATKNKGDVRGHGSDELFQTAKSQELALADAGLVHGKVANSIMEDGEKINRTDLQGVLRVDTAYQIYKDGSGHAGALYKGSRDSSDGKSGLTRGQHEFHNDRQKEIERSSTPRTAAMRAIRSTLENTVKPEELKHGEVINKPTYDVKDRNLQDTSQRQNFAEEMGHHRDHLKNTYRAVRNRIKDDPRTGDSSVEEYSPSENEHSEFELSLNSRNDLGNLRPLRN